ncbi:cis-prenyltransferase [Agyrium rufum]|nr:cis-prenyltransferase [Agyrium rufum]
MPSMHLSQFRRWLLQSPPVEWVMLQLRELVLGALRQGPVPQHIAFVMDGNRRFAKKQQIETVEGHNMGIEALARILEVCYKSGVKVVTVYFFSIENFKRSKYEVDHLMSMAKLKLAQIAEHGDLLAGYGAKLRVLGSRDMLAPDLLEAIQRTEELTKNNGDAILNVCLAYTSRHEITTAIKDTVVDFSKPAPPTSPARTFSEAHVEQNIRSRHLSTTKTSPLRTHSPASAGTSDTEESNASTTSATTLYPSTPPDHLLKSTQTPRPNASLNNTDAPEPEITTFPDPETITSITLNDHMFTVGMPPLDLLVRTSGVERLSDFMLWQCHESTQISFLKCFWPELDLWTFLPVLVEWQWRRKKSEEASVSSLGSARSKAR